MAKASAKTEARTDLLRWTLRRSAAGIIFAAFLGIFIVDDIQRLNALKGLLSAVNNGVGVLYFALFGPVAWQAALLMAVAATAGGFAGVRVARRLSADRLRAVVLVFGIVVAFKLLFF